MALYPCSADGARYRGAAQAAYPALVRGRDSDREHLRLCDPHFKQYLDRCANLLEKVEYDAPANHQAVIPRCCNCGGEPGDGRLVFVTLYAKGEDEQQFYGQVCGACDRVFAKSLLIGT